MLLQVFKSKIHQATVTQADLNYVGSITIDEALMEAANIVIIIFYAYIVGRRSKILSPYGPHTK